VAEIMKADAARAKAIALLQQELEGRISGKDFLSEFPDSEGELGDLLLAIVNSFCEPVCEFYSVSSYEEIAQIAILALKQGWSDEQFWDALEHGLGEQKGR